MDQPGLTRVNPNQPGNSLIFLSFLKLLTTAFTGTAYLFFLLISEQIYFEN
jgi:hypothetical protein